MSRIYELLVKEELMNILVYIQRNPKTTTTKLYRNVKVSYAYSFNMLKRLREEEIVQREKINKHNSFHLTDKGKRIVDKLIELKNEFAGVVTK